MVQAEDAEKHGRLTKSENQKQRDVAVILVQTITLIDFLPPPQNKQGRRADGRQMSLHLVTLNRSLSSSDTTFKKCNSNVLVSPLLPPIIWQSLGVFGERVQVDPRACSGVREQEGWKYEKAIIRIFHPQTEDLLDIKGWFQMQDQAQTTDGGHA